MPQRDYKAYARTPTGKAARARAHAKYIAKRRELNQQPKASTTEVAGLLLSWGRTMNITLFNAAHTVREAVNRVDPDTGEIIETYTESRELFQNKAIACVAYAKEEAATLAGAKAMLKDMAARVEAREKRLERFETYIAECMKATGITEVKHELGLFSARLYLERDESVEIDPDADFPAALCNDPKPPTPSKTKIKAAINAGEAVAGAQIVRKDRLTIS